LGDRILVAEYFYGEQTVGPAMAKGWVVSPLVHPKMLEPSKYPAGLEEAILRVMGEKGGAE
jgi:hypothetical protein